MKKVILTGVFTLLLSVLMFSCRPSDAQIQRQVETALSAVDSDITPTVKAGTVTLEGIVTSEEAKALAETTAKSVKNVRSVVNNIVVEIPVDPDVELSKVVVSSLEANGFKDISVEVKDSVVTLAGDVKKQDLDKVLQIVSAINPLKVENNLNVKK